MSAPALSIEHAAAPARAESFETERVPDAAAVAVRPRQFFVTRRFNVKRLWCWQRALYVLLCRCLRGRWRIPPPFIPLTRGGLFTFEDAEGVCETPDDQIHVLPLGWAYSGDEIDAEEVCRPKDPSDKENYERLKSRYNCATTPASGVVASRDTSDVAHALASLPPETRNEVSRLLRSLHELGHGEQVR